MSDFKKRLEEEFQDLNSRIVKLSEFLDDREKATSIAGEYQVNLMEKQLMYMENYATVLQVRLEDLNAQTTSNEVKIDVETTGKK